MKKGLKAAEAAEIATREADEKAIAACSAANGEWNRRQREWDQAGTAAKAAAALVKKLAAENAAADQQAAARLQSEQAEKNLVAARAASEQAAKTFSDRSVTYHQTAQAYYDAQIQKQREEDILSGRSEARALRKAKEKAVQSDRLVGEHDEKMVQRGLDKAVALASSDRANAIFDRGDRDKLKKYFEQLMVAKPIQDRLLQFAAAFGQLTGKVKSLNTKGLEINEGIVADHYARQLVKFCEIVSGCANGISSTNPAEEIAGFDPYDLTMINRNSAKLAA